MIFNLQNSQKILERARKLYGEGKIDRAIKTIENGLTSSKEDFPLYLEIGKYFFEQAKYVESATNLLKAHHLAPERSEDIVDAIEASHFSGGTPVETGVLLIELYVDKSMFEEARKIIDGSSKDQIQKMIKHYENIYENVILKKNFEDYTKKDLLNTYCLSLLKQKINLKEGLALYETIFNNFPLEKEKLLDDLERVCQLNYANPYPKFLKGKFFFLENRFTEGIKYIQKATEVDKEYIGETIKIAERIIEKNKDPQVFGLLARYKLAMGKTDDAIFYAKQLQNLEGVSLTTVIKIYTQIIRKDRKNADIRLALAELYAKEGQFEPVLSELSAVIETNPDKYNNVTRIAEQIIEKDPYNSNLLYFLADLYAQRGDTQNAILSYEKLYKANKDFSGEIIGKLNKVLEGNIENLRGLNLLAEIYSYKKKFNKALFLYEYLLDLKEGFKLGESGIRKIVSENPQLIRAKTSLVLVSFKIGDHKEALDTINSILEEDPGALSRLIPQLDSVARTSPGLAKSVLQIYESIPLESIEPFILYFAKAETFCLSEDYKNAVIYYNKCFSEKPELADKIIDGFHRILEKKRDLSYVNFALASIYLKIDNIKGGLLQLAKASALNPKLSNKIIHILYELLKRFPSEPAITEELLKALIINGSYEQVIIECEDAIERVPREATGFIYLIHGQASLEKGLLKQAALSIVHALDIDETLAPRALELLKKANELDRKNAIVRYGIAKAYIAAKEYGEAASQFYEITKSDPSKIGKAVEELKKIIEIDRVNPAVHFTLGSLYLTEKHTKNAIEQFRSASELDDSYIDKVIGKLHYIEKHHPVSEVHINLGELYTRKKLFSKATHHLMEAYRKDKNLMDQVSTCLNRVKKADPRNIFVLYAIAEISEKENDIVSIIDIYKTIIDIIPEELAKLRDKVQHLLERHNENIELRFFYAKLLSLNNQSPESIAILKSIAEEQPDKIMAVISLLKEMSDSEDKEATFSLVEYQIAQNNYEDILPLLNTLQHDFSFHNRIIDLLKSHISQETGHIGIVLYLANFLFLRDDWKGLKELLSRATPDADKVTEIPLLLLDFLLHAHEGNESRQIKKTLVKNNGQKAFYKSLTTLENEKLKFQLSRIRYARKKSPKVQSLMLEEAELLNLLRKPDEAIELLSRTFTLRKDALMSRLISAKSFLLKNNPVRAIEILRGISIPSDKALEKSILLLLSSSYEKMGDYKSALITLKRCKADLQIDKRIKYLGEMVVLSNVRTGFPIISS